MAMVSSDDSESKDKSTRNVNMIKPMVDSWTEGNMRRRKLSRRVSEPTTGIGRRMTDPTPMLRTESGDEQPRDRLTSAQFRNILVKSIQGGGDVVKEAWKVFQGDLMERGSQAMRKLQQLRGIGGRFFTTDDLDRMRRNFEFDPTVPRTTLPWRRRKFYHDDVRIFAYVDPLLKLYQQAGRSKGTPLPPPERETISFVLGVCDVIVTTILVCNWPNLYCFYHTTRFVVLIYFRIFEFIGRHWGTCLFEVCYFINVLLIKYITGRGHWNEETLKPIFLLCNGPVMWGAIIFQNSLVFHSATKYTSAVLHFSPPLTCWVLRWKVSMPPATQPLLGDSWGNFFDGFGNSVCLFCAHQIFWWVLMGIVLKPRLKKDKEASNCFIALTESKSGLFYDIVSTFGERWEELLFIVLYSFGATVSMLPALLFWNSIILHTVVLSAVLILLIWNAGDFYIQRQELTVDLAREVYSKKKEFGG